MISPHSNTAGANEVRTVQVSELLVRVYRRMGEAANRPALFATDWMPRKGLVFPACHG
jgi:hypothetical protein